ncbi:hypothetical protein OIY81_1776 [Cryptosporidium canis]|uniref:Uncharacterized protein n=1 Tax=Cryptosporidium canis TaxID=195482 RepID=A0ABQ8P6D7_9CRYT|nr:hypothetical protein OJ252_2028 [Cryptosporidium canis]KAJ1611169.1 hypothetical protein OIY81_1776 [Cryptosporidium canis]
MSGKIELVRELCSEIRYLRALCEENNIDYRREGTAHLEDEESILNSFEFDSMTDTLLLLSNMSKYNEVILDRDFEKKEVSRERLTRLRSIIDLKGEIKVSCAYTW